MRAILALAANDLRLLSRRPGRPFLRLRLALLVAVFFGLLFPTAVTVNWAKALPR